MRLSTATAEESLALFKIIYMDSNKNVLLSWQVFCLFARPAEDPESVCIRFLVNCSSWRPNFSVGLGALSKQQRKKLLHKSNSEN